MMKFEFPSRKSFLFESSDVFADMKSFINFKAPYTFICRLRNFIKNGNKYGQDSLLHIYVQRF